MNALKSSRKLALLCVSVAVLLIIPAAYLQTAERAADAQDPLAVLDRYLRASYSRDYIAAYRDIAATDRRIKDLDHYARERGALSGFALEAAKKLAESIAITDSKKTVDANRAEITVRFKVPDANRVAPLLLSWDSYQLNALPAARQRQILDSLDRLKRDGGLSMIEGDETFALVQEKDGWKVFLNWAAGVKVIFQTEVPAAAQIETFLPQKEVVTQTGQLFNLSLKVKNRGAQEVVAQINHLIEPKEVADYLDLVECGFLLPVRIPAGAEQEYSSTYLLRGSMPDGVRQLKVTYDVKVEK